MLVNIIGDYTTEEKKLLNLNLNQNKKDKMSFFIYNMVHK